MKLISMTDFVLTLPQTSTFDTDQGDWHYKEIEKLEKIRDYANFLKQPLTLGMFTPCDEKGNILEEKSIFNTTDEDYIFDSESFDNYQKAKERVLFDGFKITEQPKSENIEYTLNRNMVFVGIKYRTETKLRLNDIMAKSNIESLVYRDLSLVVPFEAIT